jgi:hypothetical protein
MTFARDAARANKDMIPTHVLGKAVQLQMRLIDYDGNPFANREVSLVWGKKKIRLKTTSDGVLVPFSGKGNVLVSAAVTQGELHIKTSPPPAPKGDPDLAVVPVAILDFGASSDDDGLIARVNNLGLLMGTPAILTPPLTGAALNELYMFARLNGLPATANQTLYDRLTDAHDTATGALVK